MRTGRERKKRAIIGLGLRVSVRLCHSEAEEKGLTLSNEELLLVLQGQLYDSHYGGDVR